MIINPNILKKKKRIVHICGDLNGKEINKERIYVHV